MMPDQSLVETGEKPAVTVTPLVTDHSAVTTDLQTGSRRPLSLGVAAQRIAVWPVERFAEVKRRPISGFLASFIVVVLLPALVAGIYLGFFCTPRYTTEFRVAIRSVQPMNSGGLSVLLGMSGMSQTSNDSFAIVQYLQSRAGVDDLQQYLPLRSLYDQPSIDWFSRLGSNESDEAVVRYWNRMLNAYYETSTGTIVVAISAFKPDDALALAQRALEQSEQFVNRMSTRIRNDTVAVAENEVAESEQRLKLATDKLEALQNQSRIMDPRKAVESTQLLVATLRDEIVKLNAQLTVELSYLQPDSPSVRFTKENIKSLEDEVRQLDDQVTPPSDAKAGEEALSGVLKSFSQLESDRVFAEKAYQSSLASLETARVDAARQQAYLETIVKPKLPEEQSFPRLISNVSEVFGVAFLLWLIGVFAVHGIREHL
jgi:capsular polysaccharide transport system permease protein